MWSLCSRPRHFGRGYTQAGVLFEHDLTPEFLFWFEHGEEDYPVFQSPSIGPSGAALKVTSKPRRVVASADEALGVIEISLVQPVHRVVPSAVQEAEPRGDTPDAPAATVRRWLSEAKAWFEQTVGLYALYQYPIVWEPLEVHPVVGFVDLEAQTFQMAAIEPDDFIPFRLSVEGKVQDGHLVDGGLVDFSRLADCGLHFPLFLLQRALWQRNVQLRFWRHSCCSITSPASRQLMTRHGHSGNICTKSL